jgi:hypothetical protein
MSGDTGCARSIKEIALFDLDYTLLGGDAPYEWIHFLIDLGALDRGTYPKGFANLRVHDLKHTFGHRLEAAGVSDRDCQVLLGHASKGITRQYMAPEVARLLEAAESVLETEGRTRRFGPHTRHVR